MHYLHKLNVLLFIIIYLISSQRTSCIRIAKDGTYPKSKCYKNITSQATTSSEFGGNSNSKCITLSQSYCLGIKLPYNSIIIPDYLAEFNIKSFEDAHDYLEKWTNTKKLPKCWPNIQAALCSVLMPQCVEDPVTGRVARIHRPNVDICNDLVNKDECKFVGRHFEDWPSLFNCSDTNLYDRNCTNELRDLKYSSSTAQPLCQYPLVPTSEDSTWFKDIGGCAIHCKFPISSPYDLANIGFFIRTLCIMGLSSIIAAIILFQIHTTKKSSRMDKVIKRCSKCQLLIYTGWSLQIILNSDIACSSSGSSLNRLPLVANSCVLSLILTYAPSLSNLLWCAHLVKLYNEKFEVAPTGNADIERTLSMFNYGIPLTLFVSVAFLGHIDGHGLYGICTVGQQSTIIKTIFVIAPTIIGTLYMDYFFIKIIIKLALVNSETRARLHGDAAMEPSKRGNFIRISALAVLITMQAIFTTVNYFYEHENQTKWLDSIDSYIGCQMNLSNLDPTISPHDFINRQECTISAKPIITLYYLELLSTLSPGIVIASWTFRDSYMIDLRKRLIVLLSGDYFNPSMIDMNLYEHANGNLNHSRREADGYDSNDDQSIDFGSDASDGLQAIGCRNMRKLSIETPTSLGSIALQGIGRFDSDNSINTGHMSRGRGRHHKQRKGLTSRDIVNDCRQRNNLVNVDLLQQQVEFFFMQTMCQQFNPPDFFEPQKDPEQQPRINHGFCTYDSGANKLDAGDAQAQQ